MPPKSRPDPKAKSSSRALISTGAKAVQSTGPKGVSSRHSSKKDGEVDIRPTTERALILRKQARGEQAVVATSQIIGREKLDWLAEDLVKKTKNTQVLAPFRLETCLNIAEAQFAAYLDDINLLKNHNYFYAKIEEELRTRSSEKDSASKTPKFIAQVVADLVHNTYLLASGWRLVTDMVYDLQTAGLTDDKVVAQLQEDEEMRNKYLALYDTVQSIVEISQTKFSVTAMATNHFEKYFLPMKTTDSNDQAVIFQKTEAKAAGRSFLDSIVLELAFPSPSYPRDVLYSLLRDAVEEAPREAKRFPQRLWDAVGDYSVAVQLQRILDTPLHSTEGQALKGTERTMPESFDRWVNAQLYSEKAANLYASLEAYVSPLKNTMRPATLDGLWSKINENYRSVAQVDVDTLWNFEASLLKPKPQWHHKGGKKPVPEGEENKKEPLRVTYGGDETDDEMPGLEDVSDSSDDEASDKGSDESDGSDYGESTDGGYDTDQEDEMRDQYREAMDYVAASGWFSAEDTQKEHTPFTAEDRKSNPFLTLLSSLRGRMFKSSPKFRSAKGDTKIDPTKLPKPSGGLASVEEVEDEDQRKPKKKKKKPKKKKKKTSGAAADGDGDGDDNDEDDEPQATSPTIPQPAAAPPVTAPKTPVSPPKPAPKAVPTSPPKPAPAPVPLPFGGSTTTLVGQPSTAQSARSYIQTEGLDKEKVKVKTKAAHASIFHSVVSKFKGDKDGGEKETKAGRSSWFNGLNRKRKALMHQILRTEQDETKGSAGMKWEDFVNVLKDIGFTYDPSTAGSSVRFDPPDKRDRPISFHKPHPDSTLSPIKLKEYSKRLKDAYGWLPEDLDF